MFKYIAVLAAAFLIIAYSMSGPLFTEQQTFDVAEKLANTSEPAPQCKPRMTLDYWVKYWRTQGYLVRFKDKGLTNAAADRFLENFNNFPPVSTYTRKTARQIYIVAFGISPYSRTAVQPLFSTTGSASRS